MEHNLIDEYVEKHFIGKKFDEKLNQEMSLYFQKRKFSILGYLPRPGTIAMVHTLDESGCIKEVGASEPFDIINNNFGKWLAAMHSPISNISNDPNHQIGSPGNLPIDITNTGRTKYFYNSIPNDYLNSGGGVTQAQIGSGLTVPALSDFDTETPFIGGPEAAKTLITGTGAYAPSAGQVTLAFSIGAVTQNGTINEVALFHDWLNNDFMISHDAVSPAVNFIIGETIFVQYFFQL